MQKRAERNALADRVTAINYDTKRDLITPVDSETEEMCTPWTSYHHITFVCEGRTKVKSLSDLHSERKCPDILLSFGRSKVTFLSDAHSRRKCCPIRHPN